jgi:hypothetical protein
MADETEVQEQSDFPTAWRPAAGDSITGTLQNVEVIDPSGNGPYPCLTLLTAEGERNVHSFHVALRSALGRRRPKIGDEVTISYLGQKEGGRNGWYHAYRVVGGQAQEFDWDNDIAVTERTMPDVPIAPAPTPSQVQTPAKPAGEQFGEKPPFAWVQPSWDKQTAYNPFD